MWRLEVGLIAFLVVVAVEWLLCSDRFQRWCGRLDRRVGLQ